MIQSFARLIGPNQFDVLLKDTTIAIGRGSHNNPSILQIANHRLMSRHQMTIYFDFDAQEWKLVALGKGGVLIGPKDRQRLINVGDEPITLHNGDRIEAHDSAFFFLLPEPDIRAPRPTTNLSILEICQELIAKSPKLAEDPNRLLDYVIEREPWLAMEGRFRDLRTSFERYVEEHPFCTSKSTETY
ncbi:hypothetical protein BLNAU_6364 [Blattamonas nauphoetae]|uniref:FHA domain-containing protein n=1 Tax=Blattamonas nauphoetae TaxID=2049346 RepID=A0ABQ9Y4G8_9EUKA|nr:hypothetical protein BLNAU_6364 [Blattamonas nauphoetae]